MYVCIIIMCMYVCMDVYVCMYVCVCYCMYPTYRHLSLKRIFYHWIRKLILPL